jgi:hypothetical protein
VYELYGLVVHGWGTDPNGDHCIEWGGSPVYEKLIETNCHPLNQQRKDLRSMVRIAYIAVQTGVVVNPVWASILAIYNGKTKKHDGH